MPSFEIKFSRKLFQIKVVRFKISIDLISLTLSGVVDFLILQFLSEAVFHKTYNF